MKIWAALLSLFFALSAAAQTVPDGTNLAPPPERAYFSSDDCLYINGPFYLCDEVNAWETLELPEDLRGVGLKFEDGITATVEIMASPWVGIQVRAQRYSREVSSHRFPDELTTVDGFPAVTHIFLTQNYGEDVVISRTNLMLYQLNLRAETMQVASSYTPEHAARHAEMLAGITHEWSFD